MEYTDAPSTQIEPAAGTMLCPNCGATLAENAQSCPHCNWTRLSNPEQAEGTASDVMALLLSVIPGLGHVYKGHKLVGFLFFIGMWLVGIFAVIAAVASAGFGLGLAVFYWIAVALHAYAIKDRVVPKIGDEEEQY